MGKFSAVLLSGVVLVLSGPVQAQQSNGETPQDVIAAQIRLQGFSCDKPLGAKRDAKRSRADRAVWILKCSNATYRVTRAPDMAANVEQLR